LLGEGIIVMGMIPSAIALSFFVDTLVFPCRASPRYMSVNPNGFSIIMGHSMGAGTTSNVAMEYPNLPKAIILEDPAWGMFPPKPENAEEARKNHEKIRAYQTEVAGLPLEDIKARCRKDNPTWPEEEIITWANSRKLWDTALFDGIGINTRPYEEIVTRIQFPYPP
jgi:pimeloyl-ACP methyl ester carboxylesterase